MKFFRNTSLCVDGLVVGVDGFLQIVASWNVLKFTYSHHFVGVETRKKHFGLLNTTPGKHNVQIPSFVLVDLAILK